MRTLFSILILALVPACHVRADNPSDTMSCYGLDGFRDPQLHGCKKYNV